MRREFLRDVPLPPDLEGEHIFQAMEKTRDLFRVIHENTGIRLNDIIQANNFSGMVSNVFTKMLGEVSAYQPYHDQKYPDLMHKSKGIGLEVKASNKPMKGGEGHNGHSGWHIVVCFQTLENGDIEFSQVEIANLIGYERERSDWQYQGSRRNSNQSQRTETYVTTRIGTAKLRDGTAYLNPELASITPALRRNREGLAAVLPIPDYSPFKRKD